MKRGILLNNGRFTFLRNGWSELAARWILGGTFVTASFFKITAPAGFAKIIYGYQLFPALLINLIAIIVPYVELITGVALIIGFYPRSAALIVNFMLIAFIIAISINLIRGHTFDCGCFGSSGVNQTSAALGLLFRDIFLLGAGAFVSMYRQSRIWCVFDPIGDTRDTNR